MLTAALALAAFVAGLTGSWSPCGFSMIATLGPQGHAGGRGTTAAACAAFVPGALVGGIVTFASLSALGALLGGGQVALIAGAAVAGAAALAEATGRRIVPQIRRQVPEHWRRVLPLPAAAAAYGVLLGLGFTTFVLTFAVPALAGVALAVGDVGTGLVLGLAFGAGRALPVVVLAPLAESAAGIRATELMAERPAILRGFRAADAVALAAVALALGAQSASAQAPVWAGSATDPSTSGAEVAWKVPGGPGILRSPLGEFRREAQHLAIGGPNLAVLLNGEVQVVERATGDVVARLPGAGVDKVAVSERWVVFRHPADRLIAWPLPEGAPFEVAAAPAGGLGRPALDGDRVVFHVAARTESRIDEVNLATRTRLTLRRHGKASLLNPSILGTDLLYVRASPYSQSVMLNDVALAKIAPAIRYDKGYETAFGPHRTVRRYPKRTPRKDPKGTSTTLWTTALAPDAAYVTRLRHVKNGTIAELLRLER